MLTEWISDILGVGMLTEWRSDVVGVSLLIV